MIQEHPLTCAGIWPFPWGLGARGIVGGDGPAPQEDGPAKRDRRLFMRTGMPLVSELDGTGRGTLDEVPLQKDEGDDERCGSNNHASRQ